MQQSSEAVLTQARAALAHVPYQGHHLHPTIHLRLSDGPTRLPLLRESPGDLPASVTVRRQRGDLLVAVESAGQLEAARLLVHLDGDLFAAPRGLRLPLPRDLARPGGIPFSVGLEGLQRSRRGPVTVLRRWSGGVPDTMAAGEPGRLFP